MADGPLIVQSDRSVLLEAAHPRAGEARRAVAGFAELEAAPEHVHTYRISPLSLWNAAVGGLTADDVLGRLAGLSRYPVPEQVDREVRDQIARYGRLELRRHPDGGPDLLLTADHPALLALVARARDVAPLLADLDVEARTARVGANNRGVLKQALTALGWPARDLAGYRDGLALAVHWNDEWPLRTYQEEALDAFAGGEDGGSGVVVLPPGSGKTAVGLAALARVGAETLILSTSVSSLRQWRRELLRFTDLRDDQVGEYDGRAASLRPVTLATYQRLTHRRDDAFPHLAVFGARDWGLVIYDEVHSLPAPVFREAAGLQARRRLGLTATLVREDGREPDVFSLIGPKRYDAPWRLLEASGHVAEAVCFEVRVELDDEERMTYAVADSNAARLRLASETPAKLDAVRAVLARHPGEPTLVMGTYLDGLATVAEAIGAPMLSGRTPQPERERLLDAVRAGQIPVLVMSKVGSSALDLPEVSVLCEISGTWGSRQEEAQRLGRALRPKAGGRRATFYAVVARDTIEQDAALRRQRFLAEQGYRYTVLDAAELALMSPAPPPPAA